MRKSSITNKIKKKREGESRLWVIIGVMESSLVMMLLMVKGKMRVTLPATQNISPSPFSISRYPFSSVTPELGISPFHSLLSLSLQNHSLKLTAADADADQLRPTQAHRRSVETHAD
ncbi:hypothetical protein CMV_006101 [Castanea mollissima]|uniref:Uncharacterized protein n=1 Tax=Castanea mollissima TaxID=60419 RepID=A0A8J4RRJ9_9ROSI|nr:hypothetical protein CMV_006101 [Castanea mollissima]